MNIIASFARRAVRRSLQHVGTQHALLRWRAWESLGEQEIRLLKYLVDPRKTAIDIGAAQGVYAYYLQRLARRCIAFEPNPNSYAALKRVLPNIELHQAAVSAVEGEATLRVPVVNGVTYSGWGTIDPRNQLAELPPHTVVEIRVRTLCPDDLALGEVGFVKIDVEGHELEVLTGLSSCIARCLPNLLIEIGGPARGGSLAQVRANLEPLGYIALKLDESGVLRGLGRETEIKGAPNVIFVSPTVPVATPTGAVVLSDKDK